MKVELEALLSEAYICLNFRLALHKLTDKDGFIKINRENLRKLKSILTNQHGDVYGEICAFFGRNCVCANYQKVRGTKLLKYIKEFVKLIQNVTHD